MLPDHTALEALAGFFNTTTMRWFVVLWIGVVAAVNIFALRHVLKGNRGVESEEGR